MYSVLSYALMASDGVRMDAYARAIARAVRPGGVVVDLGSGSGILALLAAKAGARRVHAVETNHAVWLLRDLAADNGLSDRIEIHNASSFDVELPERADVIVSDLRGSFPLYEAHLASLRDARSRWLAPGGTMMPARDRLMIAAVEHEPLWRLLEHGWRSFERRGLSASAARNATVNCKHDDAASPLPASSVLTRPEAWAELHYGEDFPRVVESSVELEATRGGIAHALALWFEATVIDGVGYTTAPGQELAYRRAVLPLCEPIPLEAGDIVKAAVRVDATGERWAWDTEVVGAGGVARARFRQATFLGMATSPEALLREATTSTPTLSLRGERALAILEQMDGRHTVEQIAGALDSSHGTPREASILDEIRLHVRRYAR